MQFRVQFAAWAALATAAVVAISSCGGNQATSLPQPTDTATPLATSTPATLEVQTVIGSSDLSVGPNRLIFALIDNQSGPIRTDEANVSTYFLTDEGSEGPKEAVNAVFRTWPAGPGGVYSAQLSFDRAGNWVLEIVVAGEDGSSRISRVKIEVNEESRSPAIGSLAPRSANRSARDVDRLEELTTDPNPDPDLYDMTIGEAILSGKPLVVVFSTPAFCETATCGPQLDVVKGLKERFMDRANFTHVEVIDNPLEMQGDLTKGRLSPTFTEWNLPSEPWTFIVDSQGLVFAKFEGFATSEELEEALAEVIR